MLMSAIAENLKQVQDRIAVAAERAGRSGGDVLLIGVSKTWPAEVVQRAVDVGVRVLGENRVQEAHDKVAAISGSVSWHLIGHLQRNKVKLALSLFDVIHSVDSLRLAREISRRAALDGRRVRVLIQVNTSDEDSKFGVAAEDALDLVGQAAELDGIQIEGLMTIGAFLPDPEDVRPCFERLRRLRAQIADAQISGVSMKELSMGMTNDFEAAVEEGANLVRIGTAIFGARIYQ